MSQDRIALSSEPITAADAIAHVTVPNAGGISLFSGNTRAENSPQGRRLVALDYEAYPEMALAQLQDLAVRARQRWPILNLVIIHGIGRVAVGEPSVLIAVSTPHRAEAFEACRWLIDTLKAEVAIWKKEIWEDGSGTWVEAEFAPTPAR
jgi:molybdopterin synthase catalytic subunit